jgi:hypothetical protein
MAEIYNETTKSDGTRVVERFVDDDGVVDFNLTYPPNGNGYYTFQKVTNPDGSINYDATELSDGVGTVTFERLSNPDGSFKEFRCLCADCAD